MAWPLQSFDLNIMVSALNHMKRQKKKKTQSSSAAMVEVQLFYKERVDNHKNIIYLHKLVM